MKYPSHGMTLDEIIQNYRKDREFIDVVIDGIPKGHAFKTTLGGAPYFMAFLRDSRNEWNWQVYYGKDEETLLRYIKN